MRYANFNFYGLGMLNLQWYIAKMLDGLPYGLDTVGYSIDILDDAYPF